MFVVDMVFDEFFFFCCIFEDFMFFLLKNEVKDVCLFLFLRLVVIFIWCFVMDLDLIVVFDKFFFVFI